MSKAFKNTLIGCLYADKKDGGNKYVTVNLKEMKNKRYLVQESDEGFNLYISKIGNLAGSQVRDLENYELADTFTPRESPYGTFFVSSPDSEGLRMILNTAKEGKTFSYVLTKETSAFVAEPKADKADAPKYAAPATTEPAKQARRTFA